MVSLIKVIKELLICTMKNIIAQMILRKNLILKLIRLESGLIKVN
ncbi:hypothetical protein SBF1_5150003 [Candidatus Desulfosporosinus infrequens]|uniref:Uncharacterized protein n=1 Tax=Candidatus Desulfosporosinus infrequens TaxID=2043169 RepID=A0A2U3LI08_9FIRM|nr:hypothetical protein SBF1_5150003 [Candidatus Desulfosporosinus infrequens]